MAERATAAARGEGRGAMKIAVRAPIAIAVAALIALAGLAGPAWPGGQTAAASAGQPRAAGHGGPARLDVGGPELARRGVVVHYPAQHRRRLPGIPASAYVIADAGTGQVLAAKDAHGEYPPASTLKVLTAITLIPRLNPDARVVASARAASVVPSIVGLIPGQRYRASDLFRALLLISANDAAVALVQAAGSYHRGIALMNAEARHLQAYDVVARDPNGLPAAGQHVSAYDLALIARRALAIPAFMRYDSTLTARFPVRPRQKVTLVNQNTLLTGYRGGIGGKIGWTEESEATYIGLARRHGVTLIVTIMHCTPLQEISSGERLLNWGFAMDGKITPVGTLVPPRPSASGAAAAGPPRPKARTSAAPAPAAGAGTPAAGTGRAARAASAHTGAGGLSAGTFAVIAGIVAAAALAFGWVAGRRRRAR